MATSTSPASFDYRANRVTSSHGRSAGSSPWRATGWSFAPTGSTRAAAGEWSVPLSDVDDYNVASVNPPRERAEELRALTR